MSSSPRVLNSTAQPERREKALRGVLRGTGMVVASLLCLVFYLPEETRVEATPLEAEFRETTWPVAAPESHGLDVRALEELALLVKGAGFVAHRGKAVYRWGYDHRPRYAASVKKSLISALTFQAVEKGLLTTVDEPVVRFEPRLAALNGGLDSGITWRHLGCMVSGYGMTDAPGTAFAYNDYAVALWYDTLMGGVYREKGSDVLLRQLAKPLGFEDEATFQAFGPNGPEPKLRISARDLARFGQMLMNGGEFLGNSVLSATSMSEMTGSIVPVDVPLSEGRVAKMLEGQKTVGGSWNISPIGPGRYTFHLWLNKRGPKGLLMLPFAPEDTMLASGKWGESALWVIPSLELVVAWNDSEIDDHHLARQLPEAEMNQAARLMVKAVADAPVGVAGK